MTKLTLTAFAVLAVLSGSALAGPNGGYQTNQNSAWATQNQNANDFQLQGR
jgi:hypothetical protein